MSQYRYKTGATLFTDDGTLDQVDYVMCAIDKEGDLCLGIAAEDGILLAAVCSDEKLNETKLIDNDVLQGNIQRICEHVCCAFTGLDADANVLINRMRLIAQRYQYNYGEPIPVEQLVSHLCEIKQVHTQCGGNRPFGVSILYGGWDERHEFQLYLSDAGGDYSGWIGVCIGKNSSLARTVLQSQIAARANMIDLENAKLIAIRAIIAAFNSGRTSLKPANVKMAVLESKTSNKVIETTLLSNSNISELIRGVLQE